MLYALFLVVIIIAYFFSHKKMQQQLHTGLFKSDITLLLEQLTIGDEIIKKIICYTIHKSYPNESKTKREISEYIQ